MTSKSFTEMLEKQTTLMLQVARRLEDRGYAVLVRCLNRDATHEQHMYSYVSGGLKKLLITWAAKAQRSAVLVEIFPGDILGYNVAACEVTLRDGRVLDHPFSFKCEIPTRVRFRPIHATLGLVSRVKEGRYARSESGTGALLAVYVSGYVEYQGKGRDALEILIRTLEMPDHRALLKAPTTQRSY